MNKNYAILTDSTSDLSETLRSRFEIDDYLRGIISTPNVDSVEADLDDKDDAFFDDFYKKLKANPKGYKTAAISFGGTKERLKMWLEKGQDILVVLISGALSATYKICLQASKELLQDYPERKIYIVDSLGASSGYGLLMDKLADLRDGGMSAADLYCWAEDHKLNLHHWFFSTDLKYYVRGGRISKASGFIGITIITVIII